MQSLMYGCFRLPELKYRKMSCKRKQRVSQFLKQTGKTYAYVVTFLIATLLTLLTLLEVPPYIPGMFLLYI